MPPYVLAMGDVHIHYHLPPLGREPDSWKARLMGRGKTILGLAIAGLVAWFLHPIWEWYLYHFLDNAARAKGGLSAAVSRVFAVTAPAHGFLLGVSVGMILAFAIGYWDQIVPKVRYWFSWAKAVLWLSWQCRPGVRRISHGFVWLYAKENAKEVDVSFPAHTDTVRIEWWPREKVHVMLPISDKLFVRRVDPTVREDINISYELFGQIVFRSTIRKWQESGYIRSRLNFRDWMREREKNRPEPASLDVP